MSLALGQWGMVHNGCPMKYGLRDNGTVVDFAFGAAGMQYVEFGFDIAALREFLPLAHKALEELEAVAQKATP
jgi:hypothetical protein